MGYKLFEKEVRAMPLYEYRCKVCGQVFEKLSSLSGKDEDKRCPACGAVSSEKLISGFLSKTAPASGSKAASGGRGCGGG